MSDTKNITDLTLDDLKSGIPAETPPANPQPASPGGSDTKLIFANATGASATDTVIDIPNRESFDQLTEMLGGKDAVPAAQDLRKVVARARCSPR